jgi:hypothetical protein
MGKRNEIVLIGLIKQDFMLHSFNPFVALNLVSLQPNGASIWVYLFADYTFFLRVCMNNLIYV